MTVDQHAAIFDAYLSRLSLVEIERIHEAIKKSWDASMNLGMNAQLKAQRNQNDLVKEVVGNWLEHDRNNVESIISRNI